MNEKIEIVKDIERGKKESNETNWTFIRVETKEILKKKYCNFEREYYDKIVEHTLKILIFLI